MLQLPELLPLVSARAVQLLLLQEVPRPWLQMRLLSPLPRAVPPRETLVFDVMCAPSSCHGSPIPQAPCLSPLLGCTMVQPASRRTMVSRQ